MLQKAEEQMVEVKKSLHVTQLQRGELEQEIVAVREHQGTLPHTHTHEHTSISIYFHLFCFLLDPVAVAVSPVK